MPPVHFKFVLVSMGQGDCTLVRCPDGKIIVIDCGRTAEPDDPNWYLEAQALLRTPNWAGGNGNKIDALILTHKDADHHNKARHFFKKTTYDRGLYTLPSRELTLRDPDFRKINIDTVYCSDSYADDSPLGLYHQNKLNTKVYEGRFATRFIREVTINSRNNNYYKEWSSKDGFGKLSGTVDITNQKLILYSTSTLGKSWKVMILAGNVPRTALGDKASIDNAKSLVTLFEIEGRKALFCGDMTFSTEEFLRETHGKAGDILQNIDFLQIPHHGSPYASAQKTVDTLNPKAAAVSVQFREHKHLLPSYDGSISKWLTAVVRAGTAQPPHNLDYWTKIIGSRLINGSDIAAKIEEWESNNQIVVEDEPFHYLLNPSLGVFGTFNRRVKIAFLTRKRYTANLTMTSQGTQVYTLDQEGIHYKGFGE